MVSPTQLCWSYHSSPPRQRYMPRGLSHKAQSWRSSCWGTRSPVITELSMMQAGKYDFCPFVQGWWWVSCSYHRLLCKADITSPCATLVRYCTLRYAPIDLIWLVVVLNFPDVFGQLCFPSATLCTEWVGVTIEARFERALCQTVVVFGRLMWHWDCGLVHDAFGQAVAADNSCHDAHTAIASFHIVSVEQLVIPMVYIYVYKYIYIYIYRYIYTYILVYIGKILIALQSV